MTEPSDKPGRLDLRAIAPTDSQAERVIGSIMAGLPARTQIAVPRRDDVLEIVGRHLPPVWIAAAAAVMVASSAALVAARQRQEPESPPSIDRTVAVWATQQHVPTNAELLAAFQGYQR